MYLTEISKFEKKRKENNHWLTKKEKNKVHNVNIWRVSVFVHDNESMLRELIQNGSLLTELLVAINKNSKFVFENSNRVKYF